MSSEREILDYTNLKGESKSIAVFGTPFDTFEKRIIELGAVANSKLMHPTLDKPMFAWILPKKHKEKVTGFLAEINTNTEFRKRRRTDEEPVDANEVKELKSRIQDLEILNQEYVERIKALEETI
jgi:hypothetical protein